MKKRILFSCVIVLVLVLALFALSACNTADTEYNAELVKNGGFEESNSDKDGKFTDFDNWSIRKDWDTKASYGKKGLTTTEKNDSELSSSLGDTYMYLTNESAASSYLYQEIKVDRKQIYKVSVDIRLAASIVKGSNDTYRGAYVTFLENTAYYFAEQTTASATTDNGGWKTLTFYVKPVDTDYLTICLKLGDENATSKGTAYYDNVSVMKVEDAGSATVTDFHKAEIVRYNVNVNGILFVVFLALFTVAALCIAYVLIRRLYSRPTAFLNFSQINGGVTKGGASSGLGTSAFSSPWFIASMLALGTFLVNLIFLLSMYGFGSEMNFTVNLAKLMGQGGAVRSAYATYNTLSTTSPGTLYILAIIGAMGKNLSYDGVSILIRMVNVLAAMATVVMIYLYGRKYVGDRQSTIYAALYALLPITLVMSGLDNSFTTLLVALLVATMLLLVEKKYLLTYVIFALAAILDVRALALAPIIVTYLGYRYYKDDEDVKKFTAARATIIFGFIGCIVLLYLLTLPVAIDYIQASPSKPFYGWKLLANEITANNVFVDNALGLYGMVAMNEKSTGSQTASVLNLVFLLILEMYVISLYVKNRNKQELIMLASFTLAIIAVFTLKNSYTYIFLALALGLIYTMVSGEKRMFGILGAYAFLSFLNIGQIMNNSNFVQSTSYFEQANSAEMYFVNFETTSPDFIVFCVLTVLVTLYYGYVSYSISNNGKLVDIPAMNKPFKLAAKDWLKGAGKSLSDFFSAKKSEEK